MLARFWVVARIEEMLERIVDALLEESDSFTITLKSRASLSRRRSKAVDDKRKVPEPKQRNISFPGSTAQEAWNFSCVTAPRSRNSCLQNLAVLLRILELVHSGLVENTTMTKRCHISHQSIALELICGRDIYYRHPDLFVKQSVVDRYVDDLACTFGVARSQLNVVCIYDCFLCARANVVVQTAAAKGLVAGTFTIQRQDGCCIDGMNDKQVSSVHCRVRAVIDYDLGSTCSKNWRA